MQFKAEIHVTLKRTVNDPQGLTIMDGLTQLGFVGVSGVRAGKYIEVWTHGAAGWLMRRDIWNATP